MWGIIPAAGAGSRMQPLAFSKELLPVGSHLGAGGVERPRAVSEYIVERMLLGGADKLCFVISPGKVDILEYFGAAVGGATVAYVVQREPAGLADALFRALPLVRPEDEVLVGLPDTIWFPADGLRALPPRAFSLLLFPVDQPALFDAVVLDERQVVREIQVKQAQPASRWIWGAFRCTGAVFAELHTLWNARRRRDEYIGALIHAYVQDGGRVLGVPAGRGYVDVGTLHGYREAIALLSVRPPQRRSRGIGAGALTAASRGTK